MLYILNMNRLIICAAALLLCGCFSTPSNITDKTTAEELIQFAQSALDRDRYRLAIHYYNAILERFSKNPEKVCDAEYGIASVHYKQRRYNTAKDEFQAILSKYDSAAASKNLPKKYQVLSKIRLERIAEKQKTMPKFLQIFDKDKDKASDKT